MMFWKSKYHKIKFEKKKTRKQEHLIKLRNLPLENIQPL